MFYIPQLGVLLFQDILLKQEIFNLIFFFQSWNKKVSTIFIKMAKNASSFVCSVINGCALRIIDSSTLETNNPFREKRKEGGITAFG